MRCQVERGYHDGGGVRIRDRMDSLRKCGCARCYEEYKRLDNEQIETGHSYVSHDYLDRIRSQIARAFGCSSYLYSDRVEYKGDLYQAMSDAVEYGVGMTATETRDRYIEKSAILGMAYGRSPAMIDGLPSLKMLNTMTEALMNTITAALPVKPITNPAIKLLADRLTSVKATRASHQQSLGYYAKLVKDYRGRIKPCDAEITALEKALRKLGHKIEA